MSDYRLMIDGLNVPITNVELPSTVHEHMQNIMDLVKDRPIDHFILPSRGLGKSMISQMFGTPKPGRGYSGATTNTIVTDEIGSGQLTIDKMRKAMDRISGEIYLDSEATFDGLRSLLNRDIPVEPKGVHVGKDFIHDCDIRARFEEPEFPDANTYLVMEKLDRRDPRNPNPAAGSQRRWFVAQGVKRETVKNLSMGEKVAKKWHAQKVFAILEKRDKDAADALRAHREQLRIAEENRILLHSLPDFGGF